MAALLFLLFLFGHNLYQPKCPPLHNEVIRYFTTEVHAEGIADGQLVKLTCNGFTCVNLRSATTALTSVLFVGKEVARTTDEAAVEYNKRVRECKTLNGDF